MQADLHVKPHYTLRAMTADDIDVEVEMRRQSWVETYTNPALGITEDWINTLFADKLDPKTKQDRIQFFNEKKQAGILNAWAAYDDSGKMVGAARPYTTQDGIQRVGSIYVHKDWHGTGLGQALMQKIVDWHDPSKPIQLEVVAYNKRAQAFYRKWGFEKIPDSDTLFDNKIPEFKMIRQPQQHKEQA